MEMYVWDKSRDVEIWLTGAEKKDSQLRVQLKNVYAAWKRKGYFVTVFESGEKDLYQETLDLLTYNKKRLAELEVRRAREADNVGKNGVSVNSFANLADSIEICKNV